MGLRGCPRYRSLLSESSLLKHLARAHLIGPVRVRDATCAVSTALIGNHFIRICPLSERLVTELTAHRTLALRDAHANEPGTALTAVLHALCLGAVYRMSFGACMEISTKSAGLSTQVPGLAESASAYAVEARHHQWAGDG